MLQKRNSVPLVLIILLSICLIFCCISLLCGGVMTIANVVINSGDEFDEPFALDSQNDIVIEVTQEVVIITATEIVKPDDEISDNEIFNDESCDGGITLGALENALVRMSNGEEF